MKHADHQAWIDKIREDLNLPKKKHVFGCPDRRYSREYQVAAKRAADAKRAALLGYRG